ncbi:efflux RND transporter periplasmic adaptor subunit [Clostridium sp. DL1XJH146]
MKKFSKKRIIIVSVLIIAVALIALRVVGGNSTPQGISVNTANVEQGDVDDLLSSVGTIQSEYTKSYNAKGISTIETVNVKVGDLVEEGQVLVTFDVEDNSNSVRLLEIQLDNAKLSLQSLQNQNTDADAKKADYNSQIDDLESEIESLNKEIEDTEALIQDQNSAEVENTEASQGQTSATQNTTLQSQLTALNSEKTKAEAEISTLEQKIDTIVYVKDTSIKQAENTVESAQINLDQAKSVEIEEKIVAEKAGTITAVNAEEGISTNNVQAAGGGLVEITDLNDLKIVLYIDKYEAGNVALGNLATIYDGDKEYEGEVSYIAPKADDMTGNLLVEVKVSSENSALKINFEADVDILLQSEKDVLYIPVESIKKDETGEEFVFVVQDSKAVKKVIEKGLQSDSYVEIISGLELGEEVILNPSSEILDGTIVLNGSESIEKTGGLFSTRRGMSN